MSSELHDKPLRQTVMVADVKCYLCGTISGSIESEEPQVARVGRGTPTPGHSVRYRLVGASEAEPHVDWRNIRCVRCGGPTYLDEPNIITRRIEEYNWLDERPRRGRPPKRLVEERQRERERLEARAAAA